MPSYWKLVDKNGQDADPILIDEEICKRLGKEPHPEYYTHHWWDVLGILLIAGKSVDELVAASLVEPHSTEATKIIWDVLSNYKGEVWARNSRHRS